jgi:hypothetical protein
VTCSFRASAAHDPAFRFAPRGLWAPVFRTARRATDGRSATASSTRRHQRVAAKWSQRRLHCSAEATELNELETIMRMMLKFALPVDKGNQAFKDGSLGRAMEAIIGKLKPEAAYFAPMDGKRAGMLFFDMTDPSQVVESVEPFFLNLNADVELIPVMNAADLRKGMGKAAQKQAA